MSEALLTVAIPTYNRPEPLGEILEAFRGENPEQFIILISDDSSDDRIKRVVEMYQRKLDNIVYWKNEKNLGFSANVCRLYELATTKYVWFLCDDDTVLPGTVSTIISKLIEYQPTVAILNYTWDDSYGRHMTAGVDRDTVYDDIKSFDRYDVLFRLTFLSAVVVEKSLLLDPITKNPAYKDNVFSQITISLMLLSNEFMLCEFATTVLHRNVGYKYGEFFKFYLVDHLKAVNLISHKFDNKKIRQWSIRNIPGSMALYLSQKMGLFRYNGRPTDETKKYLKEYYGTIYSILFSFYRPVSMIVPTILLKLLYIIILIRIHGWEKGTHIYRTHVNRAFTDERQTAFPSYR